MLIADAIARMHIVFKAIRASLLEFTLIISDRFVTYQQLIHAHPLTGSTGTSRSEEGAKRPPTKGEVCGP